MLQKREYQLLKCKLDSGENVIIGPNCIIQILDIISATLSTSTLESKITSYIEKDILIRIIPIIYKLDKINLIDYIIYNNSILLLKVLVQPPISMDITPDLFGMALSKSSYEFIIDFIELANIKNKNIVSESIFNNSIDLVMFNSKRRYFGEVKYINEKVLELILNDPNLYKNDGKIVEHEQVRKKLKIGGGGGGEIEEYKTVDICKIFSIKSNELQIKLLDLNYFNTIGTDLLEKEFKISGIKIDLLKFEVYQYLINYNNSNICGKLNCTKEEKLKALYFIFSKYSPIIFKEYLKKFNQVDKVLLELEEDYLNIVLETIFSEFSIELFKSLINTLDNNSGGGNTRDIINNFKIVLKKPYRNLKRRQLYESFIILDQIVLELNSWYGLNNENIRKFVQYYVSLEKSHNIINKSFDDVIIYNLFSTLSNNNDDQSWEENYNIFINLISANNNNDSSGNNRFYSLYPPNWNNILNLYKINQIINKKGYIVIKSKEDINWLNQSIKYSILLDNLNRHLERIRQTQLRSLVFLFKFSNLELLHYGIENLIKPNSALFNFARLVQSNPNLIYNHLYSNIFIKAIKECDIYTLMKINEQHPDYRLNIVRSNYRGIPNNRKLIQVFQVFVTHKDRLKLIQYLESINFKHFSYSVLKVLISCISKSFNICASGNSTNYLIKIDFKQGTKRLLTNDFFFGEMFNNYKTINYLLLLGINPITELNNDEFNLIYNQRHGNQYRYSSTKFISHLDNDRITNLIDLYLNLYNTLNRSNSNSGSNIINNYTSKFQKIINKLLNILLTIKSTTIDTIKYYYQLIRNQYSTIFLEETGFHSLNYLLKKSKLIELYLLDISIPYNKCSYYGDKLSLNPLINLSQCLNPQIYTLEYLFGNHQSSFEEIITQLIESLVIEPLIKSFHPESLSNENPLVFYRLALNSNLIYFLKIRRLDLFLKHFNFIIKLLDTELSVEQIIFDLINSNNNQNNTNKINNNNNNNNNNNSINPFGQPTFVCALLESNVDYKVFEDSPQPKYCNSRFYNSFYFVEETIEAMRNSKLLLKHLNTIKLINNDINNK